MIRPGQIYESLQQTCVYDGVNTYTRIKVLSRPGLYSSWRVQVATITPDGREIRPRMLDSRQLHESGTTQGGQPRRTGYRLVRDVEEGQ